MADINTKEQFDDILKNVTSDDSCREAVMTTYTSWASQYDQDMTSHTKYAIPAVAAAELAGRLGDKKNARILDLGAGTGFVAEQLAKSGFRNIDALDGSEEMLKIAEQKRLYKHYIHGFLGPDPIKIDTGAYDSLICVGTFVPNHADDSCFEELIRITKPGGFIVLIVLQVYLLESCQFKNFESRIESLQTAGQWTLLNPGDIRENVVAGRNSNGAVVFALQKRE